MTERRKFTFFIGFVIVFWLFATMLFNSLQYRGGVVISFLFLVWFLLTRSYDYRFLVLLSGLPFQAITKLSADTPSIAVVLYLLFIIAQLSDNRFIVSSMIAIPSFILFLLQINGLVQYNLSVMSIISGFLSIFFSVAAMIAFKKVDNKYELYQKCTWTFALVILVDIYSTVLFPRLPYYILNDKQVILDRIGRFCALNGDPNYYGQLIVVAIALLISNLFLYAKEKRIILSILCGVLSVVLAINGMRSLSKGYVVGLAAVLLFVVWFFIMEGKPTRQKPLWFIIFVVLGLVAALVLSDRLIMPMVASRAETDLFTGRIDIWKNYIRMFKDHLDVVLFGAGFSNSPNLIRYYMGNAEAAHNLYIELLGNLGIIGLIMVFYIWAPAFRKWKELLNNMSSLFFWGFVVTSMSLSASANDLMYFVFPMVTIVFSTSDYLKSRIEPNSDDDI